MVMTMIVNLLQFNFAVSVFISNPDIKHTLLING